MRKWIHVSQDLHAQGLSPGLILSPIYYTVPWVHAFKVYYLAKHALYFLR